MAYNYEYPYFDSGQFNIDWLLATVKKIEEELSGTKTYDYKGENEVLDLNDLRPNSMASFTENFNVLNAPVSGARRFVFTNGSNTGGLQRCCNLKTMEVYSRNFTVTNSSVIWAAWVKTQEKPGSTFHSIPVINTGSVNDAPVNTFTTVHPANVSDCATNNISTLMTFKTENSIDVLQLWFDRITYFMYMRRNTGNSWTLWQELNHIDFTNYYKATTVTDLNSMISPGSAFINMEKVANGPVNIGYFQVICIGAHGGISYQIAYNLDNRIDIYTRRKLSSNAWESWGSVLRQPYILHRSDTTDGNAVIAANYYCGPLNTNRPEGYAAIIGLGVNAMSDQYQIAWSSGNNLYLRFRNGNNSWTSWVKFQKASTRETLIASSLPYNISTDDEGRERMMIEENMYSRTAADSNSEYLNCPGQSLFHSDPDAQSYTEAILAREDLQTFDSIITNLEQWDMDLPLTELVEKTRSFVEQLQAVNPLADIILLSVPPIDVPFLGEELYSYTWPSGNMLTEVDETLTAFAQELGFSYITWKDYKHINHTNLLTFYDNLYEEPVYKRSLETHVSRQVKNCIE